MNRSHTKTACWRYREDGIELGFIGNPIDLRIPVRKELNEYDGDILWKCYAPPNSGKTDDDEAILQSVQAYDFVLEYKMLQSPPRSLRKHFHLTSQLSLLQLSIRVSDRYLLS